MDLLSNPSVGFATAATPENLLFCLIGVILGIPANPVMALMVGAMIIQGIVPGPNVATDQAALFWGIIA